MPISIVSSPFHYEFSSRCDIFDFYRIAPRQICPGLNTLYNPNRSPCSGPSSHEAVASMKNKVCRHWRRRPGGEGMSVEGGSRRTIGSCGGFGSTRTRRGGCGRGAGRGVERAREGTSRTRGSGGSVPRWWRGGPRSRGYSFDQDLIAFISSRASTCQLPASCFLLACALSSPIPRHCSEYW